MNVAKRLAASGCDVKVLTAVYKGAPKRERRDGYEIYRAPAIRRRADCCSIPEMISFMGGSLWTGSLLARRWRPDFALAFFAIPSGPTTLALRALFGVPYVVSLRGGDVPGFFRNELVFAHRLSGWLIRRIWKRSRAVVANCDSLARLAEAAGADTVQVIPNGVDGDVFSPERRSRPRGGTANILFVGRLAGQKGVDVLLHALAQTSAQARLLVAGDGPCLEDLKDLAEKLGIRDQVEFLGWVERESLPGIYADADILALPSRDEGMPNVVLEAMASGLPVVAASVGGTPELVVDGETGLLVAPDDVRALASALETLVSSPEKAMAMGRAGRERVECRFDWGSVAKDYGKLMGYEPDKGAV